MRSSFKQLVAVGALSSAALVGAACSNSRVPARPEPIAIGGSGMAGTTAVPANEPHQSDSVVHGQIIQESHPSTLPSNSPHWTTDDQSAGTGGSGKAGMKRKDAGADADAGTGGSGNDDNLGTGGSGFDGLGTDVETGRGTRRDSDRGTTMDNGTSQEVNGTP